MNQEREETAISVVIPSWNGAELLRQHLPAVLEELSGFNPVSECIVVDDGSTDNSIELLRRVFPQVRVISRKTNRGFGSSVNVGIAAAQHERLLLLNNDVRVTPGFLKCLQFAFDESADTFAVAALQREPAADGGVTMDGFNTVQWRNGHLQFSNRTADVMKGAAPALAYCTAGCSLFSREKVLTLGGFCELFDPFYYEDAELGLQAVRRGWRLAFARESGVEHQHGSTSRRTPWKVKLVPARNYLLLHWLLLDTPSLWRQHLAHVALRIIASPIRGRFRYVVALAMAIIKLPRVLTERRRRGRGGVRSIGDILGVSTHASEI